MVEQQTSKKETVLLEVKNLRKYLTNSSKN